MNRRPPSLAVWLLTRRVPSEWRDFVLGDLEEEFRERSAESTAGARRWFWRQTLRCAIAPPPLPSSSDLSRSQGDPLVRTLAADLRYAFRVLFRAPSFAAAVIAVLALGLGANAAIFSIVNAVLLRPLPFQEPDRLVRLFHEPPQATFPGIHRFSVSPANFCDWKRDAKMFEGMAIYRFRPFILTGGGNAEAVVAGAVGDGFFDVAHATAALGRVFLPEEDSPARSRVVVISDGFWKRHFGGARDAVGRTLTLDGESFTIVGIMPASFTVASWAITARDMWVPVAYTDAQRTVRENHNAQVIARLKPGVTYAQAQSEMDLISKRLEQDYPQANAGWGATVVRLRPVDRA